MPSQAVMAHLLLGTEHTTLTARNSQCSRDLLRYAAKEQGT